ncbi:hypothetical protein LJC68_04190 [Bacteroidales bacterium OttesenSCG-928-B11]|nr:hypothetical protein [Bacteroidales bacterium OttesenSCG-928-E04]MDL2309183.1 hypothetical protein [Bacteroidales bacterium OttesenSCG-928-C03]MDL2312059.1 hypothetical protein [Bacteroidales bacterium OttesenSCG-928-B11]
METNHDFIKKLINSYFDGKTTSAEEMLIRDYFRLGDIAPDLLSYQALFVTMSDLAGFSGLLENEALQLDGDSLDLDDPIHPQKNIHKYFFRIGTALAGVAASVLLIFMLFKPQPSVNYVMIDGIKYTDKEMVANALETSVENVKFDFAEIFSDLDDLELELDDL